MRHGKKFNHLGKKVRHRNTLLQNLSISLIQDKRMTTTLAKAKALRVHLEPLITKCKSDTTHNRRVLFSYLQNKEAINELFGSVSSTIGNRPGGYFRVIKTGVRKGYAAEMSIIEFVDFNTSYLSSDSNKKKTRRSRRKVETTTTESNETSTDVTTDSDPS